MLVVVCGVPGVGKTSVADYVVEEIDGTLLRTDVVRKDLFDDPDYTDEEALAVYDELLARAETVVDRGDVPVLDGTFYARPFRERAQAAAERAGVEPRFIKVECEPTVARERIREREGDESDATVRVHDMFREEFEPLTVPHHSVDNTGALSTTHRQVDEALGRVTPPPGDGAATTGPAP